MAANAANAVFAAIVAEGCTLPAGCRQLAFTLAQLADWRTGRGIAGQGRLARAMGVNVRTVRRLKAELAALTDSPVVVAWRHRSRPDGKNGSDAYTIALSAESASGSSAGHRTDMQTHRTDMQTHRTDCPTNIITGVPIGTTPVLERENENGSLGFGPQDHPRLIDGWAPNATHVGSARKLGVDLGAAAASFLAYHAPRGELRTAAGWARGFGGWLKRQGSAEGKAPPKPKPPEDDGEWVPV